MLKCKWFVAMIAFSCAIVTASERQFNQTDIPRVEKMPDFPQPYKMRNWKRVAKNYDDLVFDFGKTGEHLPLIWWDPRPNDFPENTFALPSFVGHNAKANNQYDTITGLGAINGATLIGINKSNQNGKNWVAMCQNYFMKTNGQKLYLNNVPGVTGASFWYELFPSILFYRIYDAYPGIGEMDRHFIITADRWVEACVGMGGKVDPWTVPDFNYSAFNFDTGKPFDNGMWKEAGSASAIAWIEYMAFTKTKNEEYLDAAKWGMDYLHYSDQNPYYEILLPHGVYTAARMNAEQGTDYDVYKLLNWCFDGDNRRHWGISAGKWGDYDCSGLSSSVSKGHDDQGYAFAMNTFNLANSLVPVVRYDDRYARSIGKWMLNAANSMRLFYANGLPESQQTDLDWAKKYDPTSCIAYEGLKAVNESISRITSDYKTVFGHVKSGAFADTLYTNKQYQVLEESQTLSGDRLEHIWEADIPKANECVINIVAKSTGEEAFRISYAFSPDGPYHAVGIIKSADNSGVSKRMVPNGSRLYIKSEDENNVEGSGELGTLSVDDIWIVNKKGKGPVAGGDAKDSRWAATNFGLYGSSFVGIFGGIIEKTNVEGILQLDCLATDYYHGPAYPTWLYYNPHEDDKVIELKTGNARKDLYDAVQDKVIKENVSGTTRFTIAGNSSALIVAAPAEGNLTRRDNKTFINDVVVDYQTNTTPVGK